MSVSNNLYWKKLGILQSTGGLLITTKNIFHVSSQQLKDLVTHKMVYYSRVLHKTEKYEILKELQNLPLVYN